MLNCSRRTLLTSFAGAAGSALLTSCSPGALRTASSPLPSRWGLATYMLGEEFGNDPAGMLRQVAALGYSEVELPHFYGKDPAVLAEAIRGAGLTCPSMHAGLQTIYPGMVTFMEPDKLIAAARTSGVSYVVVPFFVIPQRLARAPGPGETGLQMVGEISRAMTVDDWRRFADGLNAAAKAMARAGLRFAYHNHNIEFLKLEDGRTVFDLLLAETDPDTVAIELDVGWVASAGLDPVEILDRCKGRVRLMHVRDMKSAPPNMALNINSADVGSGILDWPRLLPAAVDAGVQHFYVEQDAPFADSRMASTTNAIRYLRGIGRS